jgi:transposase
MEKRRKHSEEFKREAVRTMISRGSRTIEDVAKSLGLAPSLLNKWHTKYGRTVKAAPRTSKETAEQLELRELRKRVRELEMERDILKKSTAFFARLSS